MRISCWVEMAGALVLVASTSWGTTELTAAVVDGGGQLTTNGVITMDCSLGGWGGVSTGSAVTLKSGYLGQLTEATNLTLLADTNPVAEGASCHLSGVAGMDDDTVTVLEGSNILWSTPAFPVTQLDTAGQVLLTNVYADTSVIVTGRFMGITGVGTLLVLDSNPDNFGLYAGDGLPDGWQVRYFGTNNPAGLGSVTNVSGQENWSSYLADLNPTNPASRLLIVSASNAAPYRVVSFSPSSTGRVYALQYRTNLLAGMTWTNVTPVTNWGNGSLCVLRDTNAVPSRFYRIAVQLP